MTRHRDHKSRQRRVATLREALDVYVSGRSGIRFDALMRFAGPLFDLYDVEWRADDEADALSRDEDEMSTMIAVLDTARLLWTFFSLNDDQGLDVLPDLEDALLGRAAGDEERSNLLVLLSLLEEHWRMFSPTDRAKAEDTPGYTLPNFETLLADYEGRSRPLPRPRTAAFGPEHLDVPEALAIFAEPLVRDPAIQDNPDLVEERVERAQAYWDLATAPDEEYEEQLLRIEDSFATSDQDRRAVREEAERMVARFRKLFSDRADSQ